MKTQYISGFIILLLLIVAGCSKMDSPTAAIDPIGNTEEQNQAEIAALAVESSQVNGKEIDFDALDIKRLKESSILQISVEESGTGTLTLTNPSIPLGTYGPSLTVTWTAEIYDPYIIKNFTVQVYVLGDYRHRQEKTVSASKRSCSFSDADPGSVIVRVLMNYYHKDVPPSIYYLAADNQISINASNIRGMSPDDQRYFGVLLAPWGENPSYTWKATNLGWPLQYTSHAITYYTGGLPSGVYMLECWVSTSSFSEYRKRKITVQN